MKQYLKYWCSPGYPGDPSNDPPVGTTNSKEVHTTNRNFMGFPNQIWVAAVSQPKPNMLSESLVVFLFYVCKRIWLLLTVLFFSKKNPDGFRLDDDDIYYLLIIIFFFSFYRTKMYMYCNLYLEVFFKFMFLYFSGKKMN